MYISLRGTPSLRLSKPIFRGMTTAVSKKSALNLARKFIEVPSSPDVYISRVPEGAKALSDKDPTIILIAGWMDAALPHLYKYTEPYHELYPGAIQILIRSRQSFFFKSQPKIESELAAAAKALHELGIDSPMENERLLVHVFSNGGCFQLLSLRNALAAINPSASQTPLPAKAMIFDSCPGDSNLDGAVIAFTAPLKNPVVRFFGVIAFRVLLTTWKVWSMISGTEDLFVTLRKQLLNPSNLPTNIPKTYIYSKTDALIGYKVVEAHAEEARSLGAEVEQVLYENTPHVNHVKADPAKYWDIVKRSWSRTWQ